VQVRGGLSRSSNWWSSSSNLTVQGRPFVDRALPVVLAVVGTYMVAAGGFSCRLVTVGPRTPDSKSDPYRLRGYGAMEMDGTCVSTRLGRGWSDLGPIDRVGKSLATLATVVGVLTTISTLLLFARWDVDSSRRPLSLGTALAACLVSMASAVVALLGLYSPECRADGQSCAPALMSYVVIGGAMCWASAGTILCFFAKAWQREDGRVMTARRDQPHRIELAACEYLVVPRTAVEMPEATYGWGIPVAVAVDTGIAPADGVASLDVAVSRAAAAAAKDPSTTTVLIEAVANEDGTTTKTRTTTVTRFDKNGNLVIERTIERL
jgi:hypothetical protein